MAKTQGGFGRLLVAIYAVFAISATARSLYQIFSKFEFAPFAYALSAVSGLVYILATWALASDHRKTAWFAVCFEMVGVVTVGVLTVLHPEFFADDTVWTRFGAGYGYLPLVLPIIGLWWLWRTRSVNEKSAAGSAH